MAEKYVVPKLMGGLGNQLHMISAAMDVAIRTNRTMIFNYISHNPHSSESRSLCDLFPHVPIRSDIQVVNDYPGETFYYKDIVPHINHEDTCISISGYNQHPKYIPEGFCRFLDTIPEQHPYVNMSDTAFVHFRRKDYVGHPYYEINMDVYYSKAVKTLLSMNPNVKLLVISDDTAWSNHYITNLLSGIMNRDNILYLDREYTATESLKIMANCLGGAICANSSFSWWGAYVNRNRPIFMPNPWITLDENPNMGMFFEGVTKVFWKTGNIEPELQQHIYTNNSTKSLVSVTLGNCGLGNKIFKILAGLAYAEKYNKQFVIDKSRNIPSNTFHTQNLDTTLMKLFPNIHWVDSLSSSLTINEGTMFIYSDLPNCSANVLLDGYFQNEQYFPSSSLIPDIRTSYYPNTYFVHIRAGDYINNPQFDILTNNDYYRNCFNILGQNAKYIVCSNDNLYADNYMKNFNVQYTISDKIDPLETLIEMANCAGGICANSSLSWLGAFFQREPRKNIFMPSLWLNNGNPDIQYPKWATVIDIYSNLHTIKQDSLLYLDEAFDIVIPVGPNDIDVIGEQILYTKRNIIGYRNIYLIYKDSSLQLEDCITISENTFIFSMQTVEMFHGKLARNGWYLQQLLKLYAGRCINGILESYLVIDSDTFFLKPTRFIQEGKYLYSFGTEYNIPYFTHMNILHPSLIKMDNNKSGICHHMMFNTKYLNELFKLVEDLHSQEFYKVFLSSVDASVLSYSGASEYEIYFNFLLKYHPETIIIRPLIWSNVEALTNNGINDYESVHWYIRNTIKTHISQTIKILNIPNLYSFNSLKIGGIYVIIDIFRSSKYNSLVFLCNNKNYIKEQCDIDILTLSVNGFTLHNLTIDRSKEYIEIDRNYFPNGFHHEIFYITDFPESISTIDISLNNINYTIEIPMLNIKFTNSKCLTTIQKDEIHLIEPWIEWHKKLGFEYFFIYDNNFNINSYSDLFKKYPTELLVYNADFPFWLESYGRNRVGQVIQQTHTLWKFSPEFLGLPDLDEYIYPLSNFNIFDKGLSVLSIPNYWFGCSGNNSFQKNIVESYTKREAVGNIIHQRKCIIQSSQVDLFCVHIALNYCGEYKRAEYNEIYLRHYLCLSEQNRKCICSKYCVIEDVPRV